MIATVAEGRQSGSLPSLLLSLLEGGCLTRGHNTQQKGDLKSKLARELKLLYTSLQAQAQMNSVSQHYVVDLSLE